jgi:hypothetical protein
VLDSRLSANCSRRQPKSRAHRQSRVGAKLLLVLSPWLDSRVESTNCWCLRLGLTVVVNPLIAALLQSLHPPLQNPSLTFAAPNHHHILRSQRVKTMTKYAVNWAGIRYDYSGDDPAWANLKPGTILYVQNNGLSNASGNTIKEIGRENYIENSAKPPPMPAQTELNFTSGLKVLFVGMRPANAAKHTKVVSTDINNDGEEQKQGKKRKTNKGQSVQTQQDGLIVAHDPEATRVVVPFGKQNVNYYVLLNPDSSGICKGLSCDGDEVFFFEEFRDDIAATSFGARKIATAKAIRTAANIQTKAAPKAVDTSTAQNTEEKSSRDKISALIRVYLITSEPMLLRDCKRLLESKGTDNAERNSHLQTFLRCDEAVGKETAEEVKADIEVNLS